MMVITQTPIRVSFLGGGTDYPAYFRHQGGATLATAINKYTLVSVHRLTRFADCRIRVHYSQIEAVSEIDQIRHPPTRECLRFLGINEGIEIHYVGDLPAHTGLGSSSSTTVGLLSALHAFKGEMVSREQLAAEAVYVEQELIKERVGNQDQYICALGGFRHLQFYPDGRVSADPIILPEVSQCALQERLLMFYTGVQRFAHEVLDEQLERTHSGENADDLCHLKGLVSQGLEILQHNSDLSAFGELLHEGWVLKRRLSSKIATPWIDQLYERARQAGAVGGKLLGAGGGGFLLLYVEPRNRGQVQRALSELGEVEFAFEPSGSQVIFYRA